MSAAPQRLATPPRPQLKEVFKTSTTQKYRPAPMLKRIVAFILDSLISGVGSQLITAALVKILAPSTLMAIVYSFAVSIVVWWGYWLYLPVNQKGTPGKKLMGLRVVTEKHSRQITTWQMFKRESFGRLLSTFVLFLGYLSAFGDKKERRTWHDRLAKTRVIEYR